MVQTLKSAGHHFQLSIVTSQLNKNIMKINLINKIAIALLLAAGAGYNAQAQTIIGGGAMPVYSDGGYNSDYSAPGTFVLSDGSVTLTNSSTYEHGNNLLDNQGSWVSNTGSNDLFAGTGANTISGTNAPNFFNGNFSNTVTTMDVTNSNGINVAGILAFNNGLTTTIRANSSTGAIHFADDATYTNSAIGDAQYVNGYVSKAGNDAFTFPVGNQGGTDLRTLSITAPATATDQLSIAYWRGDAGTALDPTGGAHSRASLAPGLASVSPIGFWDWIPVAGTSGTTVTVSLPAQTGSGSYTVAADIRLVGWNTTSNRWEILGAGGASSLAEDATLSGTVSNLGNYSAIGWGSVTQIPLPVKLVAFSGKVVNCSAELEWRTASEQSSDRYEVEHSTDGKSFTMVGTVKSRNSATGSTYTFSYPHMNAGTHQFRLKMVDISGKYAYSNTVSLRSDCGATQISVWPNPVTSAVTVAGLNGPARVQLINVVGQLVRELHAEATSLSIDMSNYASGRYIIRIVDGTDRITNLQVTKK